MKRDVELEAMIVAKYAAIESVHDSAQRGWTDSGKIPAAQGVA